MEVVHGELKDTLSAHLHSLDEHEKTYFERFLKKGSYHMKQFYITMKVHKKNNNASRPIVSCCGSFPEGFSLYGSIII